MPEVVCRDCQSLSIIWGRYSWQREGGKPTQNQWPELQLQQRDCDSSKVTGQRVSSQCRQGSDLAQDECQYPLGRGEEFRQFLGHEGETLGPNCVTQPQVFLGE